MKGEVKMILTTKDFGKGTMLNIGHLTCRVLTEPKQKYKEWYFRILQFLTFGKRFRKLYHYECKVIFDRYGEMVQNPAR